MTHIALLKLYDTRVDRTAEQMVKPARSLPMRIPRTPIWDIRTGMATSDQLYRLVLISQPENLETLAGYQNHPEYIYDLESVRMSGAWKATIDFALP